MLRKKKKCIAMLLAGGQGSRLMALTTNTAKPAVPFGGKYRIIDFPLSNCVNSGIDTVGILTQYEPLALNTYIGNGHPWGLNRSYGGVSVLPPYLSKSNSQWYKGTANAIYQNMHFIETFDPDYVLILSGDHIYKMDYSKMIEYHISNDSDCTIAVIDVPIEEAPRFGIMNTNEDGSVYEFEEKPACPKSTNASMGIYVFSKDVLKKYLTEDENNPDSDNDFGKNVIPMLINDKKRVFAYKFDGYWKDVGTIKSLWEANMDLFDEGKLSLEDRKFKIYGRNYAKPASYFSPSAKIENSLIADGCTIKGTIENSVISSGCVIGENAVIKNSVIMPDSVIDGASLIEYAIIGEDAQIHGKEIIGTSDEIMVAGE